MTFISFKSELQYFEAERDNIKRNTVRFTDDWDKSKWDNFYKADVVVITNTDTDKSFAREITHKCTYKNIAIISW